MNKYVTLSIVALIAALYVSSLYVEPATHTLITRD